MNSVLSSTLTRSTSTTMTAARVRNVMLEVGADFTTIAVAGLATPGQCANWRTDLTALMEMQAIVKFQIQFTCARHLPLALEYTIKADGTLQSCDKAGGIDYFALPAGTRASLFVTLTDQAQRSEAVLAYMRQHNWGFDGQDVTGTSSQDRIFSAEGYGVVRNRIGTW